MDPYHKWLGIAPEEQPVNHYRLLGIRLFESNREVIESAANQRMAYLQELSSDPDSVADAQRILGEVSRARLCLLNDDKRRAYDALLQKSDNTRPQKAPTSSLFSRRFYFIAAIVGGLSIGLAVTFFSIDQQAKPQAVQREDEATAIRVAQKLAAQKQKADAQRRAREEAERIATEKANRKAQEMAEQIQKEDAERRAREEAERIATEKVTRVAQEKAKQIQKEDAERRVRREAAPDEPIKQTESIPHGIQGFTNGERSRFKFEIWVEGSSRLDHLHLVGDFNKWLAPEQFEPQELNGVSQPFELHRQEGTKWMTSDLDRDELFKVEKTKALFKFRGKGQGDNNPWFPDDKNLLLEIGNDGKPSIRFE